MSAEYIIVGSDTSQVYKVDYPYLFHSLVGDGTNCKAGGGSYHSVSTTCFGNMVQHFTIVSVY